MQMLRFMSEHCNFCVTLMCDNKWRKFKLRAEKKRFRVNEPFACEMPMCAKLSRLLEKLCHKMKNILNLPSPIGENDRR